MDVFAGLRSIVLSRAEQYYDDDIQQADYEGYIAEEYGPYYMQWDHRKTDWWHRCQYFMEALRDIVYEVECGMWESYDQDCML